MNQTADHPSTVLQTRDIDLIRKMAPASEKLGCLHPDVLELAYGEGWFRLFVPDAAGRLARSLPEAVRLEEALSWADGSLGWVVTLCAGAGWFAGFLDDDLRKDFFSDPRVCIAGSGAPTGKAVHRGGIYEVTGFWKYASGAPHATAFTANCVIEEDGAVLRDSDGRPVIRSFIFRKEEVEVTSSWGAMGMVATGSHSFRVERGKLPAVRSFIITPEAAVLQHPVYQFPFLSFAEITLAVNISGMARHFLDLCARIFEQKITGNEVPDGYGNKMSVALRIAVEGLNERRLQFYETLDGAWSICAGGDALPGHELEKIHGVSYELAGFAREAVTRLYPFCGLSAAYHSTEINRVWRDINTAGQHGLLVFPSDPVDLCR